MLSNNENKPGNSYKSQDMIVPSKDREWIDNNTRDRNTNEKYGEIDIFNKGTEKEEEDEIILPMPPELPPLVYGISGGVSYWGFSQRGESHVKSELPCQDRCIIEAINDTPLIVAAVADGVGSCVLSHYGAAIATRSAIDSIKNDLSVLENCLDDYSAGAMLRKAMNCACEAVRKEAEEMEQLEYSFQSTLTLAIYDGSTLFFSHAGDDGIVAILDDGTMDLATVRKKGEEASSVYPLQSMDWEIRKAGNVNALIMATDGVLDAFVRGVMEGNRIYYPFIEPAVKPGQLDEDKIKEVADFYYEYMAGTEYRSRVTDDLTMVVITNQKKITENNLPKFDQEEWNAYTRKREEKIKAALYPETVPEKENRKQECNKPFEQQEAGEKKSSLIPEKRSFCFTCGAKITDETSEFCPVCGNSLIKMDQNPRDSYVRDAYNYRAYESNSSGNATCRGNGFTGGCANNKEFPDMRGQSNRYYDNESVNHLRNDSNFLKPPGNKKERKEKFSVTLVLIVLVILFLLCLVWLLLFFLIR